MKKLLPAIALCLLFVVSLITMASPFTVKASPSASFDVKAEHVVDIRESGLLVINDTVTLSTSAGDSVEPLQNYVIGFPFDYHSDLAYVFAYETLSQAKQLSVDMNAGIGRTGFYAVRVNFPMSIDISNGGSYKFTVVFVFSNSIALSVFPLEEATVVFYNVSFPAYPSLPNAAKEVDLRIIMPATLNYTRSSYEKAGINFTRTAEGLNSVFSYVKIDLTEFSRDPAWFYASRTGGTTQFLDVDEVERKIDIFGNDRIVVSDSYTASNKAGELAGFQLKLPAEAFEISAFDEFGLVSESNVKTQQASTYTNTTITFTLPHAEGEEIHLLVRYSLPWKNHVTQSSFGEFRVSLLLFEKPDLAIRKLTVGVALPEGATLSSPLNSGSLHDLQSAAFSSQFTFIFQNATAFHDFALDFTYQRPIFWSSFRPTVWMGTFVLIAGALVGAWHVYQPQPSAPLPTAVVSVRAEDLRSFVSLYDEKLRLLKESGSLEAAARKGKIPRRQYKVRKTTIDGRMASVSRDLSASRNKLRMASPRYAELMRQLEVAETELTGAETEINRAEIRYRRGDLSAQAYHNVLETAYRRREKTQTTVDGVLLRLREEIS
ncbi:MAG TPA: hypothetical protein VJ249_07495 [Candidatus Bathyarchaeia archaeon]|nr:hypothetical protein [Candidatus Bathyarchaeia archaeon]